MAALAQCETPAEPLLLFLVVVAPPGLLLVVVPPGLLVVVVPPGLMVVVVPRGVVDVLGVKQEAGRKEFLEIQLLDVTGSQTPGCPVAGEGAAPLTQIQLGSPSSAPLVLPSESESSLQRVTFHT